MFVFKRRIQIDHKARQRKARARARARKEKKKKKTRENFPCCDIARIDRLIASLLIQWIAWCMAVLSWWRHLSGSCRLCVRSERERERKRKRKRENENKNENEKREKENEHENENHEKKKTD